MFCATFVMVVVVVVMSSADVGWSLAAQTETGQAAKGREGKSGNVMEEGRNTSYYS